LLLGFAFVEEGFEGVAHGAARLGRCGGVASGDHS